MNAHASHDPLVIAGKTYSSRLLAAEGLAGRRIAVEVNGEIIPRTRHADTALNAGDVVEIVHALGGG